MQTVLVTAFKRVEARMRATSFGVPLAQELCGLILVLEHADPLPAALPPPIPLRPRTPRRPRHLKALPSPPALVRRVSAPPDPVGEKLSGGNGARALLVEILRRAAYDWVLYRDSTRLEHQQLAADAHFWLFEEKDDHPSWDTRIDEGKQLTAFHSICEELDLDPDVVRDAVRNLTFKRVVASGRPPTRTKHRGDGSSAEVALRLPLAMFAGAFEEAAC